MDDILHLVATTFETTVFLCVSVIYAGLEKWLIAALAGVTTIVSLYVLIPEIQHCRRKMKGQVEEKKGG